jgi:23S rRNA A2030 N6-methylase RlmJ
MLSISVQQQLSRQLPLRIVHHDLSPSDLQVMHELQQKRLLVCEDVHQLTNRVAVGVFGGVSNGTVAVPPSHIYLICLNRGLWVVDRRFLSKFWDDIVAITEDLLQRYEVVGDGTYNNNVPQIARLRKQALSTELAELVHSAMLFKGMHVLVLECEQNTAELVETVEFFKQGIPIL